MQEMRLIDAVAIAEDIRERYGESGTVMIEEILREIENAPCIPVAVKAAKKKEDGVSEDECRRVALMYHETCPDLPRVTAFTEQRKRLLHARREEMRRAGRDPDDALLEVFRRVAASDFLSGRTERGWKCSFDWILNATNFAKIDGGNYDNRKTAAAKPSGGSFDVDEFFAAALARAER